MNGIIFNSDTGEILRSFSVSDMGLALLQIRSGREDVLRFIDADGATEYVVDDRVVPRPSLPISDVTLSVSARPAQVASDLPAGTTVSAIRFIGGIGEAVPLDIEGGVISIAPSEPATWSLRVVPPFPLRVATLTITVE